MYHLFTKLRNKLKKKPKPILYTTTPTTLITLKDSSVTANITSSAWDTVSCYHSDFRESLSFVRTLSHCVIYGQPCPSVARRQPVIVLDYCTVNGSLVNVGEYIKLWCDAAADVYLFMPEYPTPSCDTKVILEYLERTTTLYQKWCILKKD